MQKAAPGLFQKPVANVTRSFYCSYRRNGVKPTECQQCWLHDLSPIAAAGTHADCIRTRRVIAIKPFDRAELDPMERAVWEYLKMNAQGQACAKPSGDIRRALASAERGGFGLSDDVLRKCVREMRAKGYLVISCQQGFYVPQTREEILDFMKTQHSRAQEITSSVRDCQRFLQLPPEKLAALGLAADARLEDR